MVVCVFEALCTHRGPLGIPGQYDTIQELCLYINDVLKLRNSDLEPL